MGKSVTNQIAVGTLTGASRLRHQAMNASAVTCIVSLPARMRIAAPIRSPSNASDRPWNCPHDCPCDAPKQRFQSQKQPTRSIGEVENSEGFTRKNEDGREADFRLANRRLRPLGHLTAARFPVYTTAGVARGA